MCAIGWQVYLAGVCFMAGSVIQGLVLLNYPDYPYHPYHTTLITIAVIAFSIVFNTFLAVRLPLLEGVLLILHVAGLFAIIIPLWVMAPRGNTYETLMVFTDNGGWGHTGLSAMIGLITPVGVLIGYDCSVHMSEEVQDASVVMPKAIMWSVVPNGLMSEFTRLPGEPTHADNWETSSWGSLSSSVLVTSTASSVRTTSYLILTRHARLTSLRHRNLRAVHPGLL